jgi:uncharacterized coiled-coil protein SlyX
VTGPFASGRELESLKARVAKLEQTTAALADCVFHLNQALAFVRTLLSDQHLLTALTSEPAAPALKSACAVADTGEPDPPAVAPVSASIAGRWSAV